MHCEKIDDEYYALKEYLIKELAKELKESGNTSIENAVGVDITFAVKNYEDDTHDWDFQYVNKVYLKGNEPYVLLETYCQQIEFSAERFSVDELYEIVKSI